MKFRIIQRGDGLYQVQEKDGFFAEWETVHTVQEDYPEMDNLYNKNSDEFLNHPDRENNNRNLFSRLSLAQAKLKKCIDENKKEIAKKTFEVIEEVSL